MRFTHRRNSGRDARRSGFENVSTRTQSAGGERTSERAGAGNSAGEWISSYMEKKIQSKWHIRASPLHRTPPPSLLPPSLPRQRFFRLPFAYPLTYRPCESDRRSIIAYNSVHCDTRWSSSGEIQYRIFHVMFLEIGIGKFFALFLRLCNFKRSK